MPDSRRHRGSHPEDAELFATDRVPALRQAATDLCWLLDHGYALRSSVALTGNRYGLTQRQRLAVTRCVCSQEQLKRRKASEIPPAFLRGRELWIDGFNLLIGIESALSGGAILIGRDGCCRDMASLHGTYRDVEETPAAAELIGSMAAKWGTSHCRWLLDRPVSNSGRLKDILAGVSARFGWNWQIDLEPSPDHSLIRTTEVVASSDSLVLDHCAHWLNAAHEIIRAAAPNALIIDLCPADVE